MKKNYEMLKVMKLKNEYRKALSKKIVDLFKEIKSKKNFEIL